MTQPNITDDTFDHRFELEADGETAFLAYRREPGRLVLLHTEVPAELEGQGLGGALVRAAMESARDARERVVPLCSFARGWLQRHPEYAEMLER